MPDKIKNVTEFFTMDFNYESLKSFLADLTSVINKQAEVITGL